MYASKLSLPVALLTALLLAAPLHAASAKKPDPNKEQIRRLQQAQQRLEKEKAVIAGELESEKKKSEEEAQQAARFKQEAGALRAARDAVRKDLSGKEAQLEETRAELRRTKEAMQSLQAQSEGEKKRLQQELAASRQQHAACTERNGEMRKLGSTVLELYEKKTCTDSVLQQEPFTGLKRVEIENAVEDLREKLETTATEPEASTLASSQAADAPVKR